MNAADWVIVAVIGLSTLLSLLRGFTREAVSLGAWVVALMGARVLSPALSAVFIGTIENPEMREWAAFAVLFIGILAVGMLVAHMLAEAVRDSALSFGDRVLGMAFGFSRGVLVVVVAIAFSVRWLGNEHWWTESRFIPHLVLFESWTRDTAYKLAGWISG